MKHEVKKFKSLKIALKELEQFIRDGKHLQSGKPFTSFGDMRSREVLANWLVCATCNECETERFIFCSDPLGGVGIIIDSKSGGTWQTEHVFIPNRGAIATDSKGAKQGDKTSAEEKVSSAAKPDIKKVIFDAVNLKRDKGGKAYASGKSLVVFLDSGSGEWLPNAVAKELPSELLFNDVWVVGLHSFEKGEYTYFVTHLVLSNGDAPAWRIYIGGDFESWKVQRVQ